MAENDDSDKTEDPTSKRLDDARKQGQVANSREVNNLFMMGALTLSVAMFGSSIAGDIKSMIMPFIEAPDQIPTDIGHLQVLAWRFLGQLLMAGVVPLVIAVFAAVGAGYLQFGLLWSAEGLMPSLDKISPLAGFKRIFSLRSLNEFLKGLLKIAIVGSVATSLLLPAMSRVHGLIGLDPAQLMVTLKSEVMHLLFGVLCVIIVITIFDVFYQRFQHMRSLRMSRQELKEEFKDTEGDPLVKGRLRQLRMERARRRMMAEVPKSDVVVTNPTHYAVALKYDQNSMGAPRVTAKGTDKAALRIRELARENDVPVIENPPLARGLYASVEIDQEITPEFYKAVAEVISYIMKLKRNRR
ncbi:MAG: flagellar biosynthesis protein FlhB [Rhodospirillaceae bacterium]|nr:MAG: flagellar biosynthesis protein FlhB [Rhodospirillaceae bacterium]